jgi:hypothetical protein
MLRIPLLDDPPIPFTIADGSPDSAPAQFFALAYALSSDDGASLERFRGRLERLGWSVSYADGRSPP